MTEQPFICHPRIAQRNASRLKWQEKRVAERGEGIVEIQVAENPQGKGLCDSGHVHKKGQGESLVGPNSFDQAYIVGTGYDVHHHVVVLTSNVHSILMFVNLALQSKWIFPKLLIHLANIISIGLNLSQPVRVS